MIGNALRFLVVSGENDEAPDGFRVERLGSSDFVSASEARAARAFCNEFPIALVEGRASILFEEGSSISLFLRRPRVSLSVRFPLGERDFSDLKTLFDDQQVFVVLIEGVGKSISAFEVFSHPGKYFILEKKIS